MDANRFDDLTRQVMTTRLTRVSAIRGLAAGAVAALTGVSLTVSEADAKKGKKKKKKRGICLCTGSTVSTCSDRKVKKKQKKKLLKSNPCSYKGKCRGFNPCSPAPTGNGTTQTTPSFPIPPGGPSSECTIIGDACATGTCVEVPGGGSTAGVCLTLDLDCTPGTSEGCPVDNECVSLGLLKVCLPVDIGGLPGDSCATGADCSTGFCNTLGICALCPEICGDTGNEVCCVVGFECLDSSGECVVSLD